MNTVTVSCHWRINWWSSVPAKSWNSDKFYWGPLKCDHLDSEDCRSRQWNSPLWWAWEKVSSGTSSSIYTWSLAKWVMEQRTLQFFPLFEDMFRLYHLTYRDLAIWSIWQISWQYRKQPCGRSNRQRKENVPTLSLGFDHYHHLKLPKTIICWTDINFWYSFSPVIR